MEFNKNQIAADSLAMAPVSHWHSRLGITVFLLIAFGILNAEKIAQVNINSTVTQHISNF